MNSPAPPPVTSAALRPPRRARWLFYGCGGLVALLVIIVATVAVTFWWIQRPIKPVVLSAPEKTVVEQKLQRLGGGAPSGTGAALPLTQQVEASSLAPAVARQGARKEEQERPYAAGAKVLKLTERELNGLLNANTELGKSVRLDLGTDAINAYVAVRIPQDFPIGGGKMFRARGRFRVSLGNGGAPYAILEDITVFGLSLPKAWLGGLKGENLISRAVGERDGTPVLKGIKSLRVEPGALVLEVED